jgi:hypothetical protein
LNDLLEAALRYANLGYAVFPCVAGGSQPLTERGFLDASTDEETITTWWEKYPKANIGLPTNGMIVVDIDGKGNAWPEDWQHAEDLTRGAMSETPRGGSHHFFRQPDGCEWRNTQSAIASRVDTRGNGGYVIVPPSRRTEGEYRWVVELDRPKQDLPTPPAWLCNILNGTKKSVSLSERLDVPSGSNKIREGNRNGALASLAGVMRRAGMSHEEIAAAILKTNELRCEPPLPTREVEKIAASISRYEPNLVDTAIAEGSLEQLYEIDPDSDETEYVDPGPIPLHLLRVPGFINEVIDYTLDTAPYPEPALAFCGALSLQALLAGRKVTDELDGRTNLYLLGLANSGSGKDHPRKVNRKILSEAGLEKAIADTFASGEGIEDYVSANPSVLFQVDEIDSLMSTLNSRVDSRGESIMRVLLQFFTNSNSFYAKRVKSGSNEASTIHQPCLCIFGTAIPSHFYESLSEKMLTNGFVSRMLIVEAGERGRGQRTRSKPVPESLVMSARAWADFCPAGGGNLTESIPRPLVIQNTPDAEKSLVEFWNYTDDEYKKNRGDQVAMTLWNRAHEKARKLAMVYACSERGTSPLITKQAATWACDFSNHQTLRTIHMASSHVSEGEFDKKCKRLLKTVRDEDNGQGVAYMRLVRVHRWSKREHDEVREALVAQGNILVSATATGGRPKMFYHAR